METAELAKKYNISAQTAENFALVFKEIKKLEEKIKELEKDIYILQTDIVHLRRKS